MPILIICDNSWTCMASMFHTQGNKMLFGYYIIAVVNVLGCAASLVTWFWHWHRSRRADALYAYSAQVAALFASCVFLVRSPRLSPDIEARVFYAIMPGLTIWAVAPLIIERRILRCACRLLHYNAVPPPVQVTRHDLRFMLVVSCIGAFCVFLGDSWLLRNIAIL